MKILHLNDERWDSGITAYSLQVAKLLVDHGDTVTFGARPGKKPEMRAKALGIPTLPVQSFWDVLRLFRQQTWDVVNVHTGRTHSWAVLARKLLSMKKAFPIIRTRGDAHPLKTNPLVRFVYRDTSAAIAASDHVRRQYELGFGLNEEQVRTVYPSVLSEDSIAPPPPGRVGILGRLDPVKGHTVFLEAASAILKKFPKTEFLIAGKEAGVTIPILQNHARQLDIAQQVQFLGFQDSIEAFMRSCTIGVISSIGSEEVSRVCLEWMSQARPVVGSLVGCLSELIEPEETGLLVPAGDSAALAAGLLRLLENPSLAQKWGKAGHSLAKRRFSPEVQLDKTLRLYQWALHNGNRR